MNDSAPVTTKPATAPEKSQDRPGSLVTGLKLTLHMTQSVLLYSGRDETKKRPGILGLTGFAKICSIVSGTPDAVTIIEERLKYAEDRLANLQRQNDEALSRSRLKVESHSSKQPIDVVFDIRTSVAGRGAQLLKVYDDVLLNVVLLNRLGIYDSSDAAERTRLCTKYVRAAYASGFEALGKIRKINAPADTKTSAPPAAEEASQ